MRAGELDRRISIETATATQDAAGQPVESWAELAEVWAEVVPLRGRELFAAQQVSAEADTRFRIRHRADVDVTKRISYDGEVYDIYHVGEIGRREGLEILAKARPPA